MMAVEIYKPSPDSHLVQADSTDDQSKQAEAEGLKPTIDLKENQLHQLHERFIHIQQGLGTIDQERAMLVQKLIDFHKRK